MAGFGSSTEITPVEVSQPQPIDDPVGGAAEWWKIANVSIDDSFSDAVGAGSPVSRHAH